MHEHARPPLPSTPNAPGESPPPVRDAWQGSHNLCHGAESFEVSVGIAAILLKLIAPRRVHPHLLTHQHHMFRDSALGVWVVKTSTPAEDFAND